MATYTNNPTRRCEVNMTGKVNLFHVICNVDNGATHTKRTLYILAQDLKKAIEYAENHYSGEYDTTVTVLEVKELRIHDGLVMTV